jgi:hypothetical protein
MTPADTARAMGLNLGDTIRGTQVWDGGWHEAELTLIWIGEHVCVWLERCRSYKRPDWSAARETATWNVRQRQWVRA